ncbi:MAG: hypothetical protein ACRC9V_08870, partial [Aeromonas sp.]
RRILALNRGWRRYDVIGRRIRKKPSTHFIYRESLVLTIAQRLTTRHNVKSTTAHNVYYVKYGMLFSITPY